MMLEPFENNQLLYILFFAFLAVTFIQLLYFWGIFSRLAFYREKAKNPVKQPVSVVICAKNEYSNLEKNLPLILEQDYPDFDVVVVNDCSDDDTNYLLQDFAEKYKNLSIVNITQNLNFFYGKKFPLSIGIKSAKHDLLILTDADCKPQSNQWLNKIQENYTGKTAIVLGYGAYQPQPTLLNTIIRYDTLQIAMQYLSYAIMGQAYMGVGRNLSYRKSLFYKNKGFSSHYKIQSGDDDLFINSVATASNTRIEISSESHTLSDAKTTFSNWVIQKKRHLSTGRYYKFKHAFLLGLFSLSRFLFYSLFILLICYLYNWIVVLSVFGLRLITQLFITKRCMIKLHERKFLLLAPFLEIVLILFNFFVGLSSFFIKQNKWK